MSIWLTVILILQSAFYIYAGYSHFMKPRFFYKITPPWLRSYRKTINIVVGVAEILGGVGLLIPVIRPFAAWGIIALLIAVFPANIYMVTSRGAGMKIPMWFLWLRLPLQFVLLYAAYCFT